jgi:hypothetical protein
MRYLPFNIKSMCIQYNTRKTPKRPKTFENIEECNWFFAKRDQRIFEAYRQGAKKVPDFLSPSCHSLIRVIYLC